MNHSCSNHSLSPPHDRDRWTDRQTNFDHKWKRTNNKQWHHKVFTIYCQGAGSANSGGALNYGHCLNKRARNHGNPSKVIIPHCKSVKLCNFLCKLAKTKDIISLGRMKWRNTEERVYAVSVATLLKIAEQYMVWAYLWCMYYISIETSGNNNNKIFGSVNSWLHKTFSRQSSLRQAWSGWNYIEQTAQWRDTVVAELFEYIYPR